MPSIFRNGLWFLVPPLLWNVLFWTKLPAAYSDPNLWDQVPPWLLWAELGLRILTFCLPFFFILQPSPKRKSQGWALYIGGCLIYFSSWLLAIYLDAPNGHYPLLLYMAPAYTPLLWLLGIAILTQPWNQKMYWLRGLFYGIVFLFTIVHTLHAYLAWQNLPY